MSKKPYMWHPLEWLEFSTRKDWNDPTVNPDDLMEYSELQRPYALPDGVDSYPAWEWSWPTLSWPDLPPIVVPDPGPSPCNIENSCGAVGIIGPSEMLCEKCYPYTAAWVFLSCGDAPWWAALSSWHLEPNETGCYLLFPDPILIATVCCPEAASGTFTLFFEGPLECSDSIDVEVTCDDDGCCDDMVLTGASTVTAGSTWFGQISPACGDATCNVVSNSGCSLSCNINERGSQVTVATGGSDCGAFTITVERAAEGECELRTASVGVRIIDGVVDWEHDQSFGGGCTGDCGGGGITFFYDSCLEGEYKYGGFDPTDNNPCEGTWLVQCKGGGDECTCSGGSSPPPCSTHSCGCDGTYCCCSWSWWRCTWTCTC